MGNFPALRLRQDSLVLAPLEGLTTAVYRRTLFRRNVDIDGAVAPFIGTIRGLKRYAYHLRDILPEANNSAVPLIPQILGRDPEGVEVVARACANLGYSQVNWNIGCPVPNVVRKKRGSGILPHPEMVEQVLERLCRPGMPAFSLKMRLGLNSSSDWRSLLPVINNYQVDFVVLHPRTGTQMYRGVPDEEAYGEFLSQCRHPVCYSGDIRSFEDYSRLAAAFPSTTGWMLGRGILSRPVLAEEIRQQHYVSFSLTDALAFLDELKNGFLNEGHHKKWVLGKMKLHFSYLKQGCDNADAAMVFWSELRKTTDWNSFLELFDAHSLRR